MAFKVGDIISLPDFPYKPFKVTYASNFLYDDTVIITPIGRFENKSFRKFTQSKLKEMRYILYIRYMRYKNDIVLVPVISGCNKYKNLVYKKTGNIDNEYELIGEE